METLLCDADYGPLTLDDATDVEQHLNEVDEDNSIQTEALDDAWDSWQEYSLYGWED